MRQVAAGRERISTHASLAGRDAYNETRPYRHGKFQPTRPLRDATKGFRPILKKCGHFNPRVPCGTRRRTQIRGSECQRFQPTRPLRDATARLAVADAVAAISTHASLAGRDYVCARNSAGRMLFQPTRPLRDATHRRRLLAGRQVDFNPRVPCGTRRVSLLRWTCRARNFHPRVPCGTRLNRTDFEGGRIHFNPRVPCGTRPMMVSSSPRIPAFQPTRPLRDATSTIRDSPAAVDFNPRVPCGTRPEPYGVRITHRHFNPRVPCGTRQDGAPSPTPEQQAFQPTRPLRDATLPWPYRP